MFFSWLHQILQRVHVHMQDEIGDTWARIRKCARHPRSHTDYLPACYRLIKKSIFAPPPPCFYSITVFVSCNFITLPIGKSHCSVGSRSRKFLGLRLTEIESKVAELWQLFIRRVSPNILNFSAMVCRACNFKVISSLLTTAAAVSGSLKYGAPQLKFWEQSLGQTANKVWIETRVCYPLKVHINVPSCIRFKGKQKKPGRLFAINSLIAL